MLAQRVATAAVGIPIILALIFIGGWPYTLVAAVGLAVAAAEFEHLHTHWRSPRTIFTALIVGGVAALAYPLGGGFVALFAFAALLTLAGGLALSGVPRSADEALAPHHARDMALAWLYVGVLGSTIVLLRDLEDGRDWVLLAVLGTFAVDTAAYFTGRTFGRHHMAPTISPKKTWEGFAGGWAGGIAAVLLLNVAFDLDAAPAAIVALAVTLPLAAAAGDLVESWLKRRAQVKDASGLLPGHGGVLDRLDSLLFTFPLVWLVARWLA